MIRVTENLAKISDLLAKAAVEAQREPGSVKLLAVSKRQSLDKVLEAHASGQRDFGENLVQEAVEKIRETRDLELTWHFVGHLQSNKTRVVAEYFDWVHTIDKLKTAKRLSQQRPADRDPLNICIQVNVDGEASKSGIMPNELPELARACVDLPNLRLRGLMCLPAIRHDNDEQRKPFARLREMAESLRADGIEVDTLSMGMTDDYRAAILEGATIVRIGTAIFGERSG